MRRRRCCYDRCCGADNSRSNSNSSSSSTSLHDGLFLPSCGCDGWCDVVRRRHWKKLAGRSTRPTQHHGGLVVLWFVAASSTTRNTTGGSRDDVGLLGFVVVRSLVRCGDVLVGFLSLSLSVASSLAAAAASSSSTSASHYAGTSTTRSTGQRSNWPFVAFVTLCVLVVFASIPFVVVDVMTVLSDS